MKALLSALATALTVSGCTSLVSTAAGIPSVEEFSDPALDAEMRASYEGCIKTAPARYEQYMTTMRKIPRYGKTDPALDQHVEAQMYQQMVVGAPEYCRRYFTNLAKAQQHNSQ